MTLTPEINVVFILEAHELIHGQHLLENYWSSKVGLSYSITGFQNAFISLQGCSKAWSCIEQIYTNGLLTKSGLGPNRCQYD